MAGDMETLADIGLCVGVARALEEREVSSFVEVASDLMDQPQNGDKGEKVRGQQLPLFSPKNRRPSVLIQRAVCHPAGGGQLL